MSYASGVLCHDVILTKFASSCASPNNNTTPNVHKSLSPGWLSAHESGAAGQSWPAAACALLRPPSGPHKPAPGPCAGATAPPVPAQTQSSCRITATQQALCKVQTRVLFKLWAKIEPASATKQEQDCMVCSPPASGMAKRIPAPAGAAHGREAMQHHAVTRCAAALCLANCWAPACT